MADVLLHPARAVPRILNEARQRVKETEWKRDRERAERTGRGRHVSSKFYKEEHGREQVYGRSNCRVAVYSASKLYKEQVAFLYRERERVCMTTTCQVRSLRCVKIEQEGHLHQ